MSTPEGKVKDAVRKVLKRHPAVYAFWPVQSGYGSKTLDVLLCVNKFFVSVETKAPGKKPTELQDITIEKMQLAGGIVLVIDSVAAAQKLEDLIVELYRASPSVEASQDGGGNTQPGGEQPVPRRKGDGFWWDAANATAPRPHRNLSPAQARVSSPEPDTDALPVEWPGAAFRRAA